MKTTGSTSTLRLLEADRAERPDTASPGDAGGDPTGDPARERYWARVQALRDDLARLRPAT